MSYLAHGELKVVLDNILSKAKLREQEMEIIRLRFGLDTGSPMLLEDVGRLKQTTRERVRQVEAKALKKIRESNTMDLSIYDWLLEIKPYVTLLKAIR